jgi:phospholipid transport system substrate-binding protein
MKKIIASIFIFILSLSAISSAEENPFDVFVKKILDESFAILKDKSTDTKNKIPKVEALISANMDLDWMSKFVLGRYRRSLSQTEISNFISTYSVYVVKTYGNAVKSYNDETVDIKSRVSMSENEFAVTSQLLRKNSSPVNIDYLVRKMPNGTYKIFDVVTEGISLINSHQAEFANILNNNNFDYLMSEIKNKIEKLSNN